MALANSGGSQTGIPFIPAAGGLTSAIAIGVANSVLTSNGTTASFLPPASVVPPYVSVTSASVTLASNSMFSLNFATLVTATLPAAATLGAMIWFIGTGAGLFKIQCGAGQTILGAGYTTTVGGSLSSGAQYQTACIVCTTANTGWTVLWLNGGSFVTA